MNTETNTKMYTRHEFLDLIESAKRVKNHRFMRQACAHWLAVYPGDLKVQYYSAYAMAYENQVSHAKTALTKLLNQDPEFIDAYLLQAEILSKGGFDASDTHNSLFALGGNMGGSFQPLPWARYIRETSTTHLSLGENEKFICDALSEAPENIIVAIRHLRHLWSEKEYAAALNVAQIFEKRWPDCLQAQLIKGDSLIKQHQNSEGMQVLHKCLSIDSTGQVAVRLWGNDHEYRNLWPEKFNVQFDIPVPADVAAILWGNKLGGDSHEAAEPEHGHGSDFLEFEQQPQNVDINDDHQWQHRVDMPPEVEAHEPVGVSKNSAQVSGSRKIDAPPELEQLSLRLQKQELGDARFPVFVVMSSHVNLANRYGEKTAAVIESEMETLVRVVAKKKGWSALAFLPDHTTMSSHYGIEPVTDINPWNIKLALSDLDAYLAQKGEMIGALLIIGGDEVVPFHRLPNPTDDSDEEVLSDNPYASVDANYFVPEWQVGRFPGASDSDAGLLLRQIRQSIKHHSVEAKKMTWISLVQNWLNVNLLGDGVTTISQRRGRNYGYSAAIWRRSSVATFRPIGDGKDLFISPSSNMSANEKLKLVSAPLAYFNLHGLADAPYWFGQKDLNDKKSQEDYPIALSPSDLDQTQQLPHLVFSEACYGAYIQGKNEKDSIALKYIDLGTSGFIGSTCVSYGSLTTPLIGGDLLGNIFWKNVKDGYSIGESLLRAKVELVREMTRRQGFLDGEDQKTIISFVLYGDPLISKSFFKSRSKNLVRSRQVRIVKTICDRENEEIQEKSSYSRAITQAKRYMESNLPGLSNAVIHVSKQVSSCNGEKHNCPNAALGKTVQAGKKSNHTVVVFSKSMPIANYKMMQYARVTLDSAGKMVKMAVSR